jgi:nucleotide-binding universal stress UspA family protein
VPQDGPAVLPCAKMHGMRVVVWLVEGTWTGCIEGAADLLAGLPSATVTLLYVTPAEPGDAAEAAAAGLLGRAFHGHHRHPAQDVGEAMAEEASALLSAGAARLGRGGVELLHRRGRPEREVVQVCSGADLLVAARDGDRSRLGPHSLGHATRFVVDHAPCDVLLVWPGEPPGIESMPPPPPPHRQPHGPHREPPPPHRPPRP